MKKMREEQIMKMKIACCFAFAFAVSILLILIPQAVLAEAQPWVINAPERVWAITNIRHVGALNMSQDYSHSYTGNNESEEYTHSFRVSAPEGETEVFDVLSIAPTTRGSRLWSDTSIGYDRLGTSGQLTGGESTTAGIAYSGNSGLCRPAGTMCAAMGSQFALTDGVVHTSVRTDMSQTEYDFASLGEGTVSTGCAVYTGSLDYSQLITVDGKFDVSYSADFNR
ncbi:MAG: hypothetical protein WAV32_03820 [Halobacteriota archaeon]